VSVVFIPRRGSEDLAIAALRSGVSDYLRRPVNPLALAACIDRCAEGCGQPPTSLPEPVSSPSPVAAGAPEFVCASEPMRSLWQFLTKVSRTDSNVLITGETGTGKEMVARFLHQLSPRACQPLVYVNCAALPDALLESELFGYERGAFTGALRTYPGRFRQAAGGTLVLDEIGEMTPHAQAKLLRAIESRQISPLGGKHSLSLDARVVAATNQDPESLIHERRFRSDLYFRLNVARIHIRPLRERREDVAPLFVHFIAEFNRRRGTAVTGLSAEAAQCLAGYDWPGNVRELRNAVETIFIDPPEGMIDKCHLPRHLCADALACEIPPSERDRLIAALAATRWNKSEAAKQLQWSRMTLYRKMTKYDVTAP
jgi:DNA-binding NtrC family response regulator